MVAHFRLYKDRPNGWYNRVWIENFDIWNIPPQERRKGSQIEYYTQPLTKKMEYSKMKYSKIEYSKMEQLCWHDKEGTERKTKRQRERKAEREKERERLRYGEKRGRIFEILYASIVFKFGAIFA